MLKSISSIIVISIIIALTYNHFRPNGIEIIRTKAPEVSESELFTKDEDNIKDKSPNLEQEKSLTYKQMKDYINNPNVIYIDARSPEAYVKAKIGNAINIFPHDDEAEIMNKIMDLPEDKTYFLYCNSITCDLSHELKEYMDSMLDKVFIFDGGWAEWAKREGIEE